MRKQLDQLWNKRDVVDEREGKQAYERYHVVMRRFSERYGFPVDEVTSAFVALSPNNDYHGNLRSLASVLDARANDIPVERVTVTTYNACRNRAYAYLNGAVSFLDTVKGQKVRAFRDNILRPFKSPLVTVDGHMVAAWHGKQMTMTEANRLLKSESEYRRIAWDITQLAVAHDLLPHQVQAILWLTRKRIFRVKYQAQMSFLWGSDDQWRTLCDPKDYPPYELKQENVK